jgi:hypothetical protein
MKLSHILLSTISALQLQHSDEEKKAITIQLDDLDRMTVDLLSTAFDQDYSSKESRLLSAKWKFRINNNTNRMKTRYDRTGWKRSSSKAGNFNPVVFDPNEDKCTRLIKLLDGFSSWSKLFLGNNNGQEKHNHQKKRMRKWAELFVNGQFPVLKCPGVGLYTLTTGVRTTLFRAISEKNPDIDLRPFRKGRNVKIVRTCNPNWESPTGKKEKFVVGDRVYWSYGTDVPGREKKAISCDDFDGPSSCRLLALSDPSGGATYLHPEPEAYMIYFSNPTPQGLETHFSCPVCGCENDNAAMTVF